MTEIFSQPDDSGPARASEAETSIWGRLGAQAADTLDPKNSLSGMYIARRAREASAGGDDMAVGAGGELDVFSGQSLEERQSVLDAKRAAIPDVSQSDAKLLLKQEGLSESDVHLGDAPNRKLPVLKLRIDEAHTRRDREAAIARGPQGFFPGALGFVTSLGVGMVDPVNAAAFSIPVIGEARMGKIIASAGDSILARGAARFGQGAAQGAVGTAALQPADWWLHTKDGQDYTMAQAMESVIMGAGMGGAFHAIPGGLRDWRARRQGMPLEGSPTEQVLRALNPLEVRSEPPAEPEAPQRHEEEVPGIEPHAKAEAAGEPPPLHPAEVLADLPPAVREDAIHAAMADIISDRPVRSAELLNIAADHDPRIAESVGAWNEMGDDARANEAEPQGLRLVRDPEPQHDDGFRGFIGEGDKASYSIHDADGAPLGYAEFAIDGDTARVLDIATERFNGDREVYGEVRNSIGTRQMRELLNQFREMHPEVTKLTADRVSGARKGGAYDAGLRSTEIEMRLPKRERSSPAVAAADPRWRELAEAKPDYNEPETLAESEAAEHLAEPDSLVPGKSLTALERAAADAEEVWRKLEPTLTENERALVNDVMTQLQLDRETRERIITDGAACLVAAVG